MQSIDKEFADLKYMINQKVSKGELKLFQEELLQYCKYKDLKDLYNKVMPSLAKFEKRIQDTRGEFEQCKLMIERMDEIVSHKANKVSLDDALN